MYWRKVKERDALEAASPMSPEKSFPVGLYPTIQKAFNRAGDERTICVDTGRQDNINLSSTWTKLIQLTGRFAEAYASDLLYDIADIQEVIDRGTRHEGHESESTIFICGIRRHGVDGRRFFMDWVRNNYDRMTGYIHVENHYRKVVGIKVTLADNDGSVPGGDRVTVTMRDLTDSFIGIEEADKTYARTDGC